MTYSVYSSTYAAAIINLSITAYMGVSAAVAVLSVA